MPLDYEDIDADLPWERRVEARAEAFVALQPGIAYGYGAGRGWRVYRAGAMGQWVRAVMLGAEAAVEALTGRAPGFSACFANRYEGQRQALGWHRDDHRAVLADGTPGEPAAHSAPIAVVSYGAERDFWWRAWPGGGAHDAIRLADKSLLVMPAGFQEVAEHRIPKAPGPCGPRISLTFRAF